MKLALTSRDEEVLEALTLKVHLATLEQVAVAWWGKSERAKRTARERMTKLELSGMVERHRVNVHPMLPLGEPVAIWKPEDRAPEFGPLAYQLQKRWTESLRLTTVYVASRKAANQFGGFGGKFKHRTQLTHDIHVTEIYLRMAERNSTIRERWRGEEVLEASAIDEKVPDALLMDADGLANLIIEFGGSYDARRVERFHRYCVGRRLPYEIW